MVASSKSLQGPTLALAGLAGGLAEVVWVALYCAASPLEGTTVANEIALAVRAGFVPDGLLGATGLTVHFALSLVVAFAFGTGLVHALRRGLPTAAIVPLAAVVLLGVWAFNFFVLLPVLAPAFVTLLPLGVTAASKMLFGLSMGTLIWRALEQPSRDRMLAHR